MSLDKYGRTHKIGYKVYGKGEKYEHSTWTIKDLINNTLKPMVVTIHRAPKTDHRLKMEHKWSARAKQVFDPKVREQCAPKWYKRTVKRLNRRGLLIQS